MELNYDCRSFQDFFLSSRESAAVQIEDHSGPISIVVGPNQVVLTAYSEGEDLSEWRGAGVDEVRQQFANREVKVVSLGELREAFEKASHGKHYFEQGQLLRDSLAWGNLSQKNEHFFLSLFKGSWRFFFRANHGFFIRLDGPSRRDLFLLVKNEKLELFHEPDLKSLGKDRSRQPDDVVKYLSEKHLVPVQGLFTTAERWESWSQARNPWRALSRDLKQRQAKWIPSRFGLRFFISLRAIFGV